jgi:hypothetical protein
MSDPYLELIQTHWEAISRGYSEVLEQRPVMLLDVQTGELHAFPPAEFKQFLDAQSQRDFQVQYQRAVTTGQMVLFVRDVANNQFLSYTLKLEDGKESE